MQGVELGDIAITVTGAVHRKSIRDTCEQEQKERDEKKSNERPMEVHELLKDVNTFSKKKIIHVLGVDSRLIPLDEHHHEANEDHWSRHHVADPHKAKSKGGSFGSRNVGGHRPKDKDRYDQIESIDYMVRLADYS